jgi:cytidine deaminase
MSIFTVQFQYELYDSIDVLNDEDRHLILTAKETTKKAYAPYSNFLVGAAAKLQNGEIVKGANQENASYPVSICAERTLLSSVAMLYENIPIISMAITYDYLKGESVKPVAPCGMCRQAILEYEERTQQSMRLILTGKEGKILIIPKASYLLPFSFNSTNLL